ncbi:XRE family transcriptional regulator [Enterobacter cloacae]|uniref:XRE family transcriptional regulator n=1 Tax=Enterobacter TaxID=547 RepID=UPI0007358C72|nr:MULTISPECIES: XRE family transcriptional regulator [Enterobacter]EKM5717245.1 helix-turn-helix domain-containing protein [Enterobacter cloacae]EKP1124233.1 helix-turn-helix domain-containing protein [Enterobacter cloacae]EKU2768122.1 helix-turn-helix domain-containing protein [Enterobacter cloacae]EKV7706579.1 helix-turn-helix domain-containing protein [Enterobacter cloacae]ELQ9030407.1 helix-turn-helix domain-containing protein [Enterobacter cloacae]
MPESGQGKTAALSLNIGNKIRRLRQSRGISLNELSKLSGVSKGALSKLESGSSSPRVDTLDAIATSLRLPVGDLLSGSSRIYPCFEKYRPVSGEYSQMMKFRIGPGNTSEIWFLQMEPQVTIHSPGHSDGTHEHILVHSGTLLLRFSKHEVITLQSGDFYAFSAQIAHTYSSTETAISATVVMSHLEPG